MFNGLIMSKIKEQKRVAFNISGTVFETYENTLTRFPETLLGQSEKRSHWFSSDYQQYYFDRNRQCFEAILFFYQSWGVLRCPPEISLEIFIDECNFFEIPPASIDLMKFKDGILPELQESLDDLDHTGTCRGAVWNILEHPETSFVAKIFAIISLSAIIASIICAVLETMPGLRSDKNDNKNDIWAKAELILNSWFLIELVLRGLSSPSKKKFILNWLNFIDALAVMPYFIMTITSPEQTGSLRFLRILRLVRILRLFKFSKHSTRLKIVGRIVLSSAGDLQLLMLCLCMLIVLAGCIMYYLENKRNPDHFPDIPNSLWWGIVTVTTVGYGDLIPLTLGGKLFSGCFMAFGALTMSLPVLSIVTKFMYYYEKNVEGAMADEQNNNLNPDS